MQYSLKNLYQSFCTTKSKKRLGWNHVSGDLCSNTAWNESNLGKRLNNPQTSSYQVPRCEIMFIDYTI